MTDVTVTREPLTYEAASPHSFFGDLARLQMHHDERAGERLDRHRIEHAMETRTTTTTSTAGGDFALPLYLIDRFKTSARASRPFADLLNPLPLPRGVHSISVPRLVQSGIAATETSTQQDGNTVNETDPTSAINTSTVVTITGQVVASQQLMDQAGSPGADVILGTDLKRDYDAKLEAQLLTGTGSSGQLTGLTNYTLASNHTITSGATPSFTDVWGYLGQAAAAVSNDRGRFPEIFLMAPRRWAWMASSVDNSNRPIASPGGGTFHMSGESPDAGHQGPFGPVLGIPVYCDGAIPAGSTADNIYALRPEDMYLFESEPVVSVNVDTSVSSTLAVRVVYHSYVAFVGNLYTSSIAKITGLPQPTGY